MRILSSAGRSDGADDLGGPGESRRSRLWAERAEDLRRPWFGKPHSRMIGPLMIAISRLWIVFQVLADPSGQDLGHRQQPVGIVRP
jgi:hypothetical protein